MLSNKHMKFLSIAVDLAEQNDHTKNRHASVIAKGNKMLSFGVNNRRTQMHQYSKYDYYECHAELDAVMRVRKKQCLLRGYNLCC